MPISGKRELEIERELEAIIELDSHPPRENPEPKKPKQMVRRPWAPPLLFEE